MDQLRKGSQKSAIVKEEEITPALHCQGVCEGMRSADMTVAVTLNCRFETLDPDGRSVQEAPSLPILFAEL